jgi:hypothetical protein
VEFRIVPPSGCEYKAKERCSTNCFTSPRINDQLSWNQGSVTYTTSVPGVNCPNERGIDIDVRTRYDELRRYTIHITQSCGTYASNTPGTAAGEGPPIPDLPVDPDQWNNGSCLPSLEDSLDAGSDGAATASAVGRQVDSLAESLGQEYRKRRGLILATSGDPKADLAALESEMATRFEQGTIDLYDQNKLFNPFDPGCRQPPPVLAPARP